MIDIKDITIIIPAYNAEKYIYQCITSAIEQFPKGYDTSRNIIVVNDCSTDKTEQICEIFLDKITLINHDKNRKTASALNTAIRLSVTDWVKWLSADDMLKPCALLDMVRHADNFYNEDDRIFYTNYDIIDSDNKIIKSFIEPEIKDNVLQKAILIDHFYGNGSTSLIHKDVFDKCGLFNESLSYQEDYDFWLRAVLLYGVKLTLLPINTLYYRVHDNQLTNQNKGHSLKHSQDIRGNILLKLPALERDFILSHKLPIPIKSRIRKKTRNVMYNILLPTRRVLSVLIVCGIVYCTLPALPVYLVEKLFPRKYQSKLPAHKLFDSFNRIMS